MFLGTRLMVAASIVITLIDALREVMLHIIAISVNYIIGNKNILYNTIVWFTILNKKAIKFNNILY